ncbi:MAG: PKD domain-containing protein [Gammaproteobacteria bacterium]|nr:MAG: PKD domain-containing protein [Gammaproteobacteria bacterium]
MRTPILLATLLTALLLAVGGCSDGRSVSAPIVPAPPSGSDPSDPPELGDGEGGEMWVLEGAADNPGSGRPWLLLVLFEDGDYLLGYDATTLGLEAMGAERGRIEVDDDERLLLTPDSDDGSWLTATFEITAAELDDDALRLLDADGLRFELARQDRDTDQPPSGGWAQRYGETGAAALALLPEGEYLYARAEGADNAFERGLYAYSAVNEGFDILEITVSSDPEAGFASAPGPKRLVIGDSGISLDYLNDDSSVSFGELCRGCVLPTAANPPRFGTTPIDTPAEPLFAAVSGVVFDDLDERLANVTVTAFAGGLEAAATTTDADGRYRLDIPADQGIVSLQARPPVPQVIEDFDPTEHIGFGNALAVLEPEDGLDYQRNFLVRRERPLLIRPLGEGFMALSTPSADLLIRDIPDSLNLAGGSARVFSPTTEPDAFPGEFATRQPGAESGLFSAGFASVNLLQVQEDGSVRPISALLDEDGEPIYVTVRFVLQPQDWPVLQDGDDFSHLPGYVEDPDRIRVPFWVYDEPLGDWRLTEEFGWLEDRNGPIAPEHLEAIRSGEFEGTVYMAGRMRHFSWVNCDLPFNRACITGRLVDQNGAPLRAATTTFRSLPARLANTFFTNTDTATTGADGRFRAAVLPRSERPVDDDWNNNNRIDQYRVTFLVESDQADFCGAAEFDNNQSGWRMPMQPPDEFCKDIGTLEIELKEARLRNYNLTFVAADTGESLVHAGDRINDPLNFAIATLSHQIVTQGSSTYDCACTAESGFTECFPVATTNEDGRAALRIPVLGTPDPEGDNAPLTGIFLYERQRTDLGPGISESGTFLIEHDPAQSSATYEVDVERVGPPNVEILEPASGATFLYDDEVTLVATGEDLNFRSIDDIAGDNFFWYRGDREAFVTPGREVTVPAWLIFGVGSDREALVEAFDSDASLGKATIDDIAVAAVEVAITLPDDPALTTGSTLQLAATVEGANDTGVLWSSSDLEVASVSSDGLVTGQGAGDVVITARSRANPNASDSVALEVETLNAAFNVDPASGDTNTLFAFDGGASEGDIESYAWDFGDGTSSTGFTASHQYAAPGDYAVVLTVTSSTGRMALSQPTTITVVEAGDALPPSANVAADPLSGPIPLTVTFDASGSSAFGAAMLTAFDWDFGDGSTDSGSAVTHTFTEAGSYEVQLVVTDSEGLSATSSVTISALAGPLAMAIYSPTAGPPPLEVTFNAAGSSTDANQIVAYAWDFGDGSPTVTGPDQIQVTHVYENAGVFEASLTVTDDAGLSASTTLPVDASGVRARFDFALLTGEPGRVRFDASLSSAFPDEIASYAWDFGDDNSTTSSEPIVEHAYLLPATYQVRLTVTNDAGDSDEVTLPVTLDPPDSSFILDSINVDGADALLPSTAPPDMSADGRFVVFASIADAAGFEPDTGPGQRIYVRDLETGSLSRMPRPEMLADVAISNRIAISGDGQRVAFAAANQIYLWDRDTGAVDLLTQNVEGEPSNATAHAQFGRFALDHSGDRVLILSNATDLTEEGSSGYFLIDRSADGPIYLAPGQAASDRTIDLSADGELALVVGRPGQLLGDSELPFTFHYVVIDLETDGRTWITSVDDGSAPNGETILGRFARGGRDVVFSSNATNLGPNTDPNARQVFRWSQASGELTQLTEEDGAPCDEDSILKIGARQGMLSAAGNTFAWQAEVFADECGQFTGIAPELRVRSLADGSTEGLSSAFFIAGVDQSLNIREPRMSADGRSIAFRLGANRILRARRIDDD